MCVCVCVWKDLAWRRCSCWEWATRQTRSLPSRVSRLLSASADSPSPVFIHAAFAGSRSAVASTVGLCAKMQSISRVSASRGCVCVEVSTWTTSTLHLATPASWWACRTASEHWPACSARSSLKWWPNTKYVHVSFSSHVSALFYNPAQPCTRHTHTHRPMGEYRAHLSQCISATSRCSRDVACI